MCSDPSIKLQYQGDFFIRVSQLHIFYMKLHCSKIQWTLNLFLFHIDRAIMWTVCLIELFNVLFCKAQFLSRSYICTFIPRNIHYAQPYLHPPHSCNQTPYLHPHFHDLHPPQVQKCNSLTVNRNAVTKYFWS